MEFDKLLDDRIDKLVEELGNSDCQQVRVLCSLIKQSQMVKTVISEFVDQLEDALNYLRVQIKYLIFDVEATRRERDYFKVLIEKLMEKDDYEADG